MLNISKYFMYKRTLTNPFIYSRIWDYWVLVDMGNFDDFSRTPNDFFRYLSINFNNEKQLYDSVVSESININGVELIYYSLTYDVNYNRIWGEDNDRRYERCFAFMGYYELPKEDINFTKYSIEPFDVVNISVSKKHLEFASRYDAYGNLQAELSSYKPKISDIIKSVYNNYYYEIVDINQEENMFLQSKHTWRFTVKPYKNEHYTIQNSELPYQQADSFDNGNFNSGNSGWWQ